MQPADRVMSITKDECTTRLEWIHRKYFISARRNVLQINTVTHNYVNHSRVILIKSKKKKKINKTIVLFLSILLDLCRISTKSLHLIDLQLEQTQKKKRRRKEYSFQSVNMPSHTKNFMGY